MAEDKKNVYSVSDLASLLGVPRTTVNDWLKKFDRYIDFEIRGRRKVYTDSSLEVLKLISSARDRGVALPDMEKELASQCAIRPEISPLSETEETADRSDPQQQLPAVKFEINEFLRDLEQHSKYQESIRKRGFFLISTMLIVLMAAACATLLFLGQLLTLKQSSRQLQIQLEASRQESAEQRKKAEKEFKTLTSRITEAGKAGTLATEQLRKRISDQRKDSERILKKLEKAEALREKEIRKLESEVSRLNKELKTAAELLLKKDSSIAAGQEQISALNGKLAGLRKQNEDLRRQNVDLSRELLKLREEMKKLTQAPSKENGGRETK